MRRMKTPTAANLDASLIAAWSGIFELPLPWGTLPPNMPMANWVETQDIHAWSIDKSARCVGFNRPGMLALRQLIRGLRKVDDRYMLLVGLGVLTDYVAEHLRERWKHDQTKCPDLASVTSEIDKWLSSQAGRRRHFIPCKISSLAAASFAVGPVKFVHVDDFAPKDFGLKDGISGPLGIEHWKAEQHADWIAVIDVSGREKARSLEIAELVVDLCLGVLQALVYDPLGRDVSRITGRTILSDKYSLVADEDGTWDSGWRARNSFDMPGPLLEEVLLRLSPDIQHMGAIISRYRDQSCSLPVLEQGWCDALFWFHEGLSETLDSVAIAKMETAIENLFSAESSKRSRMRLRQGFKALFGVDGPSQIDTILPVTVDEFVEAVVTARSRVLHGTWSTLANRDVEVDRRDVTRITQNFLKISARALDTYSRSAQPSDNVDAFLDWAEGNRRPRAGTRP